MTETSALFKFHSTLPLRPRHLQASRPHLTAHVSIHIISAVLEPMIPKNILILMSLSAFECSEDAALITFSEAFHSLFSTAGTVGR